jgi:hypothetical protein
MNRAEFDAYVRSTVVETAYQDVGNGDPTEYWETVLSEPHASRPPYPKHWCGGAVLTWLQRSGLALDVKWKVGKGFLSVGDGLPRTDTPLPGDIAFFDRASHHALLVECAGPKVKLIQGNSRANPMNPREEPHVRPSEHDFDEVSKWYSIAPLLEEAFETYVASNRTSS